ncbi:hypothetical protein BT96DRAFT_1005607 [Gymnopus androsaceus JB14]|uniref:MYND-type domain-containing protein n=1 Tax=Gymnopus androsaceus JB14 TaxID=1447944 RepID=A0A6A4GNX9_9AGAR|nr:hypothetical protein BT96DRAFT_1005607 [Gymnopus androsaceus JB14]
MHSKHCGSVVPQTSQLALWSLGCILDQVVHAGQDTQLSSVHYKRLFASWTDIRWWITTLLNDFVVLKQPTTPEGLEFQRKILIITPELSTYIYLQTSDEVSNKIKNLLTQPEFFEPMVGLTARTWIYVVQNCDHDVMSSHCTAIVSIWPRFPSNRKRFGEFCDVLEQIPGSERAVLRTLVQELQGSFWSIQVLWVCTDVLFGCCLNKNMFGERKGQKLWLITDSRNLSNCVNCLIMAFMDSYSWIPPAIRCGFLKSMMHSTHLIIASRPNTDSVQDVETSMSRILTMIRLFLLYRSVLQPVHQFIAQVPKQRPELYNEFINIPPNSENPETCVVTAWKDLVKATAEIQELRERFADAGHILCAKSDCPNRNWELQRCSNCRVTWYCSKDCQKSDWRKHREHCDYLRSRALCGGCPAPYSHIDKDFFKYANVDRARRFYTSPTIQSALERNPGFLLGKVAIFDFRGYPPAVSVPSHAQYRANIKEGDIYSAKNYEKIIEQSRTEDVIFSIQGVFPGEQNFSRCIITGITSSDLADSDADSGSDGEAHGENSV